MPNDSHAFLRSLRFTPGTRPARPEAARRVRLLLASFGWPSGILELASWVKHQRLADPVVVQLRVEDNYRQLVRKLVEFRPHVVGLRVEGGQFEEINKVVRLVRRHVNAEIILGGPTATSHPIDVLEESGADYVFAGEAERSLSQFLRLAWHRDSKDRQPQIAGLAYRYGGRSYFNTLARDGYGRSAMDVDHLVCCNSLRCLRGKVRPVAEAELLAANRLDWSLLDGLAGQFEGLYFTGGRGCPGACTFCAKLHGNEVRAKGAAQLLDEIEAADAKVAEGAIPLGRWPLFQHVVEPTLRSRQVAWAAIYDEDFFLNRARAVEFFRLWDRSPLKDRYRIGLQTNPCSLLGADGRPREELFEWIDRLKPMVQLGAESFHPELLARWHKQHTVRELNRALDALDATRQDYTVFQILTDFDSTPEELIDVLRLLILAGYRRRRMRIACSPFTIPLYDSDTRRLLEFDGRLGPGRVGHFTEFERPQPGWMDPLVADLADLADAELQFAVHPEHRDGALWQAFEAVLGRIRRQPPGGRARHLLRRAEWAMDQIRGARFQDVGPVTA